MVTSRAGGARSRASSSEQRAYVLHTIAYRETSLIVELFGERSGRFAVVAKGAKRPRSNLRAVVQLFQPLLVRATGQGELQTLSQADWQGGVLLPQGQALISAFYLNELLMRLLHRDDPQAVLFEAYHDTMRLLGESGDGEAIELGLRRFEWCLLRETGYAPDLSQDTMSRPIDAERMYRWESGQGFMAVLPEPARVADPGNRPEGNLLLSGQTLLDLAQSQFGSERSRQEMKGLMRRLLSEQMGGRPLKTRQIFRHLQDFVSTS